MSRPRRSSEVARRANRAGLLVAALDLPFTFERTLMPRPIRDQAVVTGLSFTANHAVTELVQESIQAFAWLCAGADARRRGDERRWGRATLALDGVAMAAGLGLELASAPRPGEPMARAAVRTAGYWLSTAAAAASVVGGTAELMGRREGRATLPAALGGVGALRIGAEVVRRLGPTGPTAAPNAWLLSPERLGLGLASAAALSFSGGLEHRAARALASAAARVLPGSETVWRPLGHALTLVGLGVGVKALVERLLGRIEHRETSFEAAFDVAPPNPRCSGSRESLVDFSTLSRQGRRYVWTVVSSDQIEEVMGEPARNQPIRAYVGLESAPDDEARVRLAIDELDRTGGFDRPWLLVMAPTGTGYVNHAAVGAFEMLTRGDCASIAIQYSARPSFVSLDRVSEGRHTYRRLFAALGERLGQLPADRRPRVVLFGESLGAWASQDAFVDRGTQGLVDTGIDHAIWIGTPYFSKWKERVLHDERPDVDRSLVVVVADIGEWSRLDPERRARARYTMVTHHDDGVALFAPELAFAAPSWLTDRADRVPQVPATMTWMPNTTFFQVLVDMKNSATVVPGRFDERGHDYRGAIVPFLDAVLGFGTTPEQLAGLQRFLEERELRRTEWIRTHGDVGASMSARLIEAALDELHERGEDADARLLEVFERVASEEFEAGGGATRERATQG